MLMGEPLAGMSSMTGGELGARSVPLMVTVAPASGIELGVTDVIVGTLYQLSVADAVPEALVSTNG